MTIFEEGGTQLLTKLVNSKSEEIATIVAETFALLAQQSKSSTRIYIYIS